MTSKQYIQNMTAYINKLPLNSSISFLFFYANDLNNPKIRNVFKYFDVGNTTCYIINGNTANNYYIYYESTINYIVNIISSSVTNQNAIIYDVDIIGHGNNTNVNHGDHIDFGIIRNRAGNTIIKTHKTIYTDIGNFVFDRSIQSCNFIFDIAKLNNFNNIGCDNVDGTPCNYNISNIYNTVDKSIINHICNTMIIKHGGSRKKQRGGNILSDDFIKFIRDIYLAPIYAALPNLESISIFYSSSNNIVMILDFIELTSKIIVINGAKAFAACKKYKNNEDIENYKEDIQKMISQIL
jgi:hypothetical protein